MLLKRTIGFSTVQYFGSFEKPLPVNYSIRDAFDTYKNALVEYPFQQDKMLKSFS